MCVRRYIRSENIRQVLELDAFTGLEGRGTWLFRNLNPAPERARVWRWVILVPFVSRLVERCSVKEESDEVHIGGNEERSSRSLTMRTEPWHWREFSRCPLGRSPGRTWGYRHRHVVSADRRPRGRSCCLFSWRERLWRLELESQARGTR